MINRSNFSSFSALVLCLILILFGSQIAAAQQDQMFLRLSGEDDKLQKSYTDMYMIYQAAGFNNKQIEKMLAGLELEKPDDFTIPELTPTEIDSLEQVFLQYQYFLLEETQIDSTSIDVKIDELRKQLDSLEVLKPWGYELFNTPIISLTPVTVGPVVPEYPLGPGDEIVVDIWGESTHHFEEKISRSGTVSFEGIGLVNLSNLTLSSAETKLEREFGKRFSELLSGKSQIQVTLGQNRMINVWVSGEVKLNKPVLLSALASPLEFLYYAGGPTDKGSLRNISVSRRGEIVGNMDVYDYMRGKLSDLRLQDNDVINVPVVKKSITVKGEIRRPAIYEAKDNESLFDLLEIAGGISSSAVDGHVQVIRYSPAQEGNTHCGDRIVIDVFNDTENAYKEFSLQGGDEIVIPALSEDMQGYVEIIGSVLRPNMYMYQENLRLNDLLGLSGGITSYAFKQRGEINRTLPDSSQFLIPFTLTDNPYEAQVNIPLENLDIVTIYSVMELKEEEFINVIGEVKEPGLQPFAENMSLKDAVLRAGGFTEMALTDDIEISRKIPGSVEFNVKNIQLLDEFTVKNDDYKLQKYDQIVIRRDPSWEPQKSVIILGEVHLPGRFTLKDKNEKLSNLFKRAGGLKETGYVDGIKFVRKDLSDPEEEVSFTVGLDIHNALTDTNSIDNIALVDGDSIFVPKIINLVQVVGDVGLESSVLFRSGAGVSYYIERAGGFTPDSDKRRIQIVLANGQIRRPKRFWPDPKIIPGSRIIVPRKGERSDINWTPIISVLTSLTTIVLIVNR